MKKILLLIALVLCVGFALQAQSGINQSSGTIQPTCSEYGNNVYKGWFVDIGQEKRVKIEYYMALEADDKVYIYSYDYQNGISKELVCLKGTDSGIIYSEIPTGEIDIVLVTDESICCSDDLGYFGFVIHFSPDDRVLNDNSPINLSSGNLNFSGTANLNIQTNKTTRMSILNSNGNVGIGTTTPAERLDVLGNVRISNGNLVVLNGNAGIGVPNPVHKLEVNGAIRAKEIIIDDTGWAINTQSTFFDIKFDTPTALVYPGGTGHNAVYTDVNTGDQVTAYSTDARELSGNGGAPLIVENTQVNPCNNAVTRDYFLRINRDGDYINANFTEIEKLNLKAATNSSTPTTMVVTCMRASNNSQMWRKEYPLTKGQCLTVDIPNVSTDPCIIRVSRKAGSGYIQVYEMRASKRGDSSTLNVNGTLAADEIETTKIKSPYGGMELFTDGLSRLSIQNGNVGIGVTNPQTKLEVDGDVRVGTVKQETAGYGNKISFLGRNENTDPLWIARYNNAENQSELRINIGDDKIGDDKLVVGSTIYGSNAWTPLLTVSNNGVVTAKEVKIEVIDGADFVFAPDYNLKSLSEVESFIKENNHLPEIPSEKEMQEEGLSVNEFQIKLLQKIEELTLHAIEQNKTITEQSKAIQELKERIKELEN